MYTNSFEGGTDGAAVTFSNSGGGSGRAFSISKGSTSLIDFSAAEHIVGALGCLMTHVSGEANFVSWTETAGAGRAIVRFPIYLKSSEGAPTAKLPLAQIRGTSSGTIATFNLGTDLKVLVSSASADLSAYKSTAAISYDTLYWGELAATKGADTTHGEVEWWLYAADGTTVIETKTTGATVNTGTLDCGQYRFGRVATAAWAGTQRLDDIVAGLLASGPIGGTPNSPPVVTVAASQPVMIDTLATIAWTESDSDGTVVSRTITRTSGPGSAPTLTETGTTSRTLTPTTQGVHVYEIVATDDLAATSTPVTHTLYVTDVTAVPSTLASNPGVWTNEGGAASIPAALADSSGTTFAASPDNPSGAAMSIGFLPLGNGPITVGPLVLKVDNVTPARTVTVELMEGANIRATRTITGLTTTGVDHAFELTTAEEATVVDPTALIVRVTAS